MTGRRFLWIGLVLLMAVAPGVTLAQGLDRVFDWTDQGFRMNYPAGWAMRQIDQTSYALLSNPDDDPPSGSLPANPLVQIVVFPVTLLQEGSTVETLQAWADDSLASAAEAGVAVEVVGEVIAIGIGDHDAARVDLEGQGALIYFVLVAGRSRVFLITGVGLLDQQAEFSPIFEAMLNTIIITESTWRLDSAEAWSLPEGVWSLVFHAPDGRRIAYAKAESLCVLDVVVGEEHCWETPDDFPYIPDWRDDFFQPLAWSPGGGRLAVIGMIDSYQDADLWIVDFSDEAFINLTDDGYTGPWQPWGEDERLPEGVSEEMQPVWSPDGARVAVERMQLDEEGHLEQATLAVIDVATGEARDVMRLPAADLDEAQMMVLGLAWSPDGTTLAASLLHGEADFDGVWLIDVEGGDAVRLISQAELADGLRTVFPDDDEEDSWIPMFAIARQLAWSPDSGRLLLWTGDPFGYEGDQWPFWADVESGAITAVALPPHPHDTYVARMVNPYQVTWSPDGNLLLVASRLAWRELDESETESDEEPPDLGDEFEQTSLYLIDVAIEQAELLDMLPDTGSSLDFWATWGPDNDVIISGYHLQLVQE